MESLVIGVPTFRRPDRLHTLLSALVLQVAELDEAWPQRLLSRIVVVDNDPAMSARAAVAEFDPGLVTYISEPRPGISAARNRLLDAAEEADLLAFIDDDETPHPGWLLHLVKARAAHQADVVAGRVVSAAEGPPDPFVIAGEFFARPHRTGVATGTPIAMAATNNLLLDLRAVRRAAVRFDDRFGLSGGEDSMFTGQLARAGARMVWCAEATVTDHVPPERMTRQYVVRKAYNLANTSALVDVALQPRPVGRLGTRARLVARELLRLGLGCLLLLRSVPTRSLPHRARGMHAVARARGGLAGVRGRQSRHYGSGTTDGPRVAA